MRPQMDDVQAMLGQSPLFAALAPGERARLEPQLVRRAWERDDYIFFEGEPAEWLVLLVSGRVKMIKHSESGRETILATFGPGQIVGEVGVLVGDTYPATAQALEPAVTASLRRAEYVALVQRHPELAWALIVELGRRLQRAHETIRSMAVEKVERRVARVLLRMANTAGERLPDGTIRMQVPVEILNLKAEPIRGTLRWEQLPGSWSAVGGKMEFGPVEPFQRTRVMLSALGPGIGVDAAGQGRNSPLVDAGTQTAASLGLDRWTTRTDGVGDSGLVDLGVHYPVFSGRPRLWLPRLNIDQP